MKTKKIAIISYNYSVETSPFIISVCSYLSDKGYETDIILDRLSRNYSFTIPNTKIIKLFSFWKFNGIWKYLVHRFNGVMDFDNRLFASRLRKIIFGYDLVFCMEFWSLGAVSKTGFPLSKCIYCSLEGLACTRPFELEYVRQLISSCAFSIIASEERGKDIDKHLGINIDWEYVPVSIRTPAQLTGITKRITERKESTLRIIQSGYFAEWACLTGFLAAFKMTGKDNVDLYLHGNKTGTEMYYKRILSQIEGMGNVTIDLNYYDSDTHLKFLSQFDIGLAFYKNYINSTDWDNLLFSSGKIASYLWAGLAVLTNIDHPHTQHPPFLYLNEITPACISEALETYKNNKERYRNAAVEHARKFYNLDIYMKKIEQRINNILS